MIVMSLKELLNQSWCPLSIIMRFSECEDSYLESIEVEIENDIITSCNCDIFEKITSNHKSHNGYEIEI